uniref:VWFA domain-containing protein n=1 Tax=Panagrolaimus sp. PS1159 TaxID=55785 RepID=A0AC35G7Q1_9BILA
MTFYLGVVVAFVLILTSNLVSSDDDPYIPCQSWIAFLYDDSNALSNQDFKIQMNFISSVIEEINYPDRIFIQGGVTEVAAWNSHQTIPQMQAQINNIEQTAIPYTLAKQLANLVTDLPTAESRNWPIGALIFMPDTSDAALKNADRFIPQLTGVQITFVFLSYYDATKLTNFSTNFITWMDISSSHPQPHNWNTSYYNAYGCNKVVTQPPSSTTPTASMPVTQPSTLQSTSTIASSTQGTSTISSIGTTSASSTTPNTSTSTSTILSTPSSELSTTSTISSTSMPTSTSTSTSTLLTTSTSPSTVFPTTTSTNPSQPSIYPRTADIVFILDDSNCDANPDTQSQKNTISSLLSNYTFSDNGVRVSNPRSIGSAGYSYFFLTDLSAFTDTYLINCHQIRDTTFTIDKALRKSMSFAYKYTRTSAEALIFVVFTINNGTSMQFGDPGYALNAALEYRNKCMNPGNIEIIQINPGFGNVNPELGNYFFKYDDPDLFNKFTNAIISTQIYDKSGIQKNDCIDGI